MRRRFHWDKKYLYWGVTAFSVIAASILFFMILSRLSAIGSALSSLVSVLSPFIWGLVITYLLTPFMRLLERSLFRPLGEKLLKGKNKEKRVARFARGFSVFLAIVVFLAVLVALVYLILPQLYSSLKTIVENSSTYFENLNHWLEGVLADFPELEQYLEERLGSVNTNLLSWLENTLLPRVTPFITNLTSGVYSVLRAVYNLVIGIIVSAYLLSKLEIFKAGCLRLSYSLFTVSTAEKLREGVRFIDKTFTGFITGKLLDSAIIGLICYIVCAILNMPYALLVSTIVGVTNIIPFFGPLIGLIPSAFIILLINPVKCLIFIIFILVLQQIDGNFIGPRILGSSIGISSIWVMFSIIIGAGLFGFWGMLLGVPVFVVIYTVVDKLLVKRLRRADLPTETEDYLDMKRIDPITRQAVKESQENAEDEPEEKPE